MDKTRRRTVEATKRTLDGIEGGTVIIDPERVPALKGALDKTELDEAGRPKHETIKGPVRVAAAMTQLWGDETEPDPKPAMHPVLRSLLEVTVTDELLDELAGGGEFAKLAFELLKETGATASTLTLFRRGDSETEVMPGHHAICAGLLVRIAKFALAIAKLSCEGKNCEVVQSLVRSVVETSVNIRFLIQQSDPALDDKFIRTGLSAERALYDLVQRNVQQRGGKVLPVERRMLDSLDYACRSSGVTMDELSPKFEDWGPPGGFRKRLELLGLADLYVGAFRMGSHSVHGTWTDLLYYQLEPKDGGFVVRHDSTPADAMIFFPMCMFVTEAMRDYCTRFVATLDESEGLHATFDQLHKKLWRAADAHERRLQAHAQPAPGVNDNSGASIHGEVPAPQRSTRKGVTKSSKAQPGAKGRTRSPKKRA